MRVLKKSLLYGLVGVALVALLLAFWVFSQLSGLPDVSSLKRYRPPAAAEVLDMHGALLTSYYDRTYRVWVPLSHISDMVIHAVVIAEDDTFFEHKGVNVKATKEALLHDLQKRRFARGGSTITQQMIKNVFLSKEKTLSRKLREYVLATRAEEILTKQQILQIYLNEVEWGENIYGIEAASRFYLDKHAAELTPAEAALLAGMLPNPRYYNPYKRIEKARGRQERVLFNMQQAKLLSPEEYDAALSERTTLRPEDGGKVYSTESAPGSNKQCYQYVLEHALLSFFGDQGLYRSGKTIRTTLDKALQEELADSVKTSGNKEETVPEKVLVLTQSGLIRAIICDTGRERELLNKLEEYGPLSFGYEVSEVSPDSIRREQIILGGESDTK